MSLSYFTCKIAFRWNLHVVGSTQLEALIWEINGHRLDINVSQK